MAQRHGTSVHVDAFRIQAQRAVVCNAHHRERFVQFPEIDVPRLQTGLAECFGQGERWGGGEPFRGLCGIRTGQDFCHRRQAMLGHGIFRSKHQGRGSVVQGRCVGCRDGSLFVKRWAKLWNFVQTNVGEFLVAIHNHRLSTSLRDFHRHNL